MTLPGQTFSLLEHMPVKPQVKSFFIADKVIQEKETNKWSAIGIFDRIYSSRFPFRHSRVALYFKIADAEGDYTIKIDCCDANGKKLALFEGLKLHVTSRLISPDFGIQTFDLPIPEPGKYYFNLFLNDESSKRFNSRSSSPSQKSRAKGKFLAQELAHPRHAV